ncbi:hypothetical protein ADK57_38885 [Streptomyces sp. MMG1533]|nr:hypothetical protein ADK57_38885 [Streptomyces sp. MMG1533]
MALHWPYSPTRLPLPADLAKERMQATADECAKILQAAEERRTADGQLARHDNAGTPVNGSAFRRRHRPPAYANGLKPQTVGAGTSTVCPAFSSRFLRHLTVDASPITAHAAPRARHTSPVQLTSRAGPAGGFHDRFQDRHQRKRRRRRVPVGLAQAGARPPGTREPAHSPAACRLDGFHGGTGG